MLSVLAALANPHRLRIIGALQNRGRAYVSELARVIGISRPLLHLHLKRLEAAGLVESRHEISADGKALNYFTTTAFDLELNPTTIAAAAATLSPESLAPIPSP